METPAPAMLRIGDWCVDPKSGQMSRNGEAARLEERTLRLLLCLAGRAGEVVSIDDLLTQVWPGVAVSPDSVYQAVATLRRQLGDNPRQPVYISTLPRLGYRLVAEVAPAIPDSPAAPSRPRTRPGFARAVAAAICLTVVAAFLFRGRIAGDSPTVAPPAAIAVLPFLDLTPGMHEEEFADGMTEELIDKLSKIPGLRVPPPTSSFYFKGKQIPIAGIARSLGVAYVLDGSVRKSGVLLRVAARLIRADNGYVIWSETYDRRFDNILMVQDSIAGDLVKAVGGSLTGGAGPRPAAASQAAH